MQLKDNTATTLSYPVAIFRFLGCQIKIGYLCAMIGSGFRVVFAFLLLQRPRQLEKHFLSCPRHNLSQPLVTDVCVGL